MNRRPLFPVLLLAVCAAARGQVAPAANGPATLPIGGTLAYDLRYTQTAQFYGALGNQQRSVLNGDLRYTSPSESHPTDITYAGGDQWVIAGYAAGSGIFQHILVSQGFEGRAWNVSVSDDLGLAPQAPIGGFSGIPGVGGLPPGSQPPYEPVLTVNTQSVRNFAGVKAGALLNYANTLGINGGYGILRFPAGGGLETNSFDFGPMLSHRLNALNSITGGYNFSRFSFVGAAFTMHTQSATFGYDRVWNRRFKTSASGGPEWIGSSNSAAIPSSTGFTADAKASYELRTMAVGLTYNQSTTSGSIGGLYATHNHNANFNVSREFGRDLSVGGLAAYMRTQQLGQTGVINGIYGGVNTNWRMGQFIALTGGLTAIHQSSSVALPSNALTGISYVLTFGIGYSPHEVHLRQ